ncbi:unnamed protein product [Prorocentrum cordatum]|uniref:Uncharacterized protein n=1 Tax=Prorocentrum cordatum TaxID=2364126 RepID=A0ABN9PKR3_9DINO|nr:unnamed protein product [Polarella glacialis]
MTIVAVTRAVIAASIQIVGAIKTVAVTPAIFGTLVGAVRLAVASRAVGARGRGSPRHSRRSRPGATERLEVWRLREALAQVGTECQASAEHEEDGAEELQLRRHGDDPAQAVKPSFGDTSARLVGLEPRGLGAVRGRAVDRAGNRGEQVSHGLFRRECTSRRRGRTWLGRRNGRCGRAAVLGRGGERRRARLVHVDRGPSAHVANRFLCGADLSDPDVAIRDVGVRVALAHVLRRRDTWRTIASLGSHVGAAFRVSAVQPVHVHRGVVPDAHDENHAAVQGIAESFHAASVLEIRRVPERRLLRLAEVVGHGGRRLVDQTGGRHLDRLAILLVRTSDLDKVAFVGPVAGQELRSDRHGFGGVDLEARTGPEESFVPEPPVVPVAAVPVALPLRARRIPVLSGSALQARALYGTRVRASVHRERG